MKSSETQLFVKKKEKKKKACMTFNLMYLVLVLQFIKKKSIVLFY